MQAHRMDSGEDLARFWNTHPLLFSVLAAVVFGYFFAGWLIPQPVIAVVDFTSGIDEAFAKRFTDVVRELRDRPEIKGVVLRMNSPGGLATASEEIYLSLLELRKHKPVVTSVQGMSASGGYYASVATNYIYAVPSAEVGSVGVRSTLPDRVEDDPNLVITGPFKVEGTTKRHDVRQIGLLQQSFVNAVMQQRGERLKLPRKEVETARVFSAIEGVQLGLIDGIGSELDALEKAAELAGVANHRVERVGGGQAADDGPTANPYNVDENFLARKTNTVPLNYFLYVAEE